MPDPKTIVPAAAALLVLLASGAARAEFPSARLRAAEPSGWWGGGALGGGNLSCQGDYCDTTFEEAGSLSGHLGRRLTPSVSLVADLWGMAHTQDRLTVTQTLFTVGVRWWAHPRLWLQGGLGVARASYTYETNFIQLSDRTQNVPGAAFALGFDVLSSTSGGFILDVQLRVGTGNYDEDNSATSTALQVAATFQ